MKKGLWKIVSREFTTNSPYWNTDPAGKIIFPFGPSIYQTEIDDGMKNYLLDEGIKARDADQDYREKLAGNMYFGGSYYYKQEVVKKIEYELLLEVNNWFSGLIDNYDKFESGEDSWASKINRMISVYNEETEQYNKEGELHLESLWINFSQKYDFNPVHHHTGEISFVVYLRAPDEIFETNAVSNSKRAGQIMFSYGEGISSLFGTEWPARPYENLMFMFPAGLKHSASPFWIDGERISVSGNFQVRPLRHLPVGPDQ